jgi:ABC-type glutathione transport system ATPase component
MAEDASRQIDWSSAEIREGALSVALVGEAPRGWSAHFEAVLRLLDPRSSDWGHIRLSKKAIEVAEVREGSEGEVRHLLESIVLQVNTELAPGSEPGSQALDGEDPRKSSDERMAATFRAFADPDS